MAIIDTTQEPVGRTFGLYTNRRSLADLYDSELK